MDREAPRKPPTFRLKAARDAVREAGIKPSAIDLRSPKTRNERRIWLRLGVRYQRRNHYSEPPSTGPVEGHVHRVKLLKRQHYGRAKLDLLRARVLAA